MSAQQREPSPGEVWATRKRGHYCVVRSADAAEVITSQPGVVGGKGCSVRWARADWHSLFRFVKEQP